MPIYLAHRIQQPIPNLQIQTFRAIRVKLWFVHLLFICQSDWWKLLRNFSIFIFGTSCWFRWDNWIISFLNRMLQNPLWKNLLLQKAMHTWTVNLNSKKEILIQKNSLFSKMEWFGAMSSNLQARGNLVFILYFPIWILLLSVISK